MGLLQLYTEFLLTNPSKLLIVSTLVIISLFTTTIYLRPLQSFSDPLVGFEARGTEIGVKINTWRLLSDETSASANGLSLLPNSPRYDGGYHQSNWNRPLVDLNSTIDPEPPIVESSIQQVGKQSNATLFNNEPLDEDEEEYYRMVNKTQEAPLIHYSIGSTKAFCGKLYEGYAQAIVSPSTSYFSHGLFNLHSLLAICQLDRRLRLDEGLIFSRDCEQYRNDSGKNVACCNSWSLPNYIACLNNKSSCMNIDSGDLRMTEHLLDICAPHYHNSPYEECFTVQPEGAQTTPKPHVNFLNAHMTNLDSKSQCGPIPEECLRCGGWIFNVMHYLTSENFLRFRTHISSPNTNLPIRLTNLPARDASVNKLTYTSIFLPIAKSSSLMKYYLALSKYSLKTPYAQVKVLNLGLKNSLFEHLISDDLRLFIIALVSILVVISIYTWSFILSLMILLIICLSLCLSYTIYEWIFNIAIFPFMNLLAIVISFGICSDNAMLFCKHWSSSKDQYSMQPKILNISVAHSGDDRNVQDIRQSELGNRASLEIILKKATASTFAATLATACSFSISAISNVMAVKCFCIFATLSVITNYLLIVLLLPPALILDAKLQKFLSQSLDDKEGRIAKLNGLARRIRGHILELGDIVHMRLIFPCITRFKFYLIVIFLALALCSSIIIFRQPGLRPADDDDVQLLSKTHIFEQYDKNLRRQFAFERAKQGEIVGSKMKFPQELPETLPIRVVFGLKPDDTGDHFDPQSRGRLIFDPAFDIADKKTQTWLLEFCKQLRELNIIRPPPMPDMSSCFMDTFKTWMEARSCLDPVHPQIDRSPCCQAYEFPFDRFTFNKCMLEALAIMRRSPHLNQNLNAGLRFFKNSTEVAAMIVEFQSNRMYTESFSKMEKFYNEIDDWVGWRVNNTAPPGLKSAWFTTNNLELFALQTELKQSTNFSILLEIVLATIALMMSTRDIVLTIAGTLTIGTIITVILAILVLLKWTLGVAESVLVSLTIGLSIDFALHYTVAYSEGLRSSLSHGVVQRILNEVGSPIGLATTTTSLAGFIIFWSDILAYQQLGTFLMLIALVSWLSSTLFLLPMLATFDTIRAFNNQYLRIIFTARMMFIDRLMGVNY